MIRTLLTAFLLVAISSNSGYAALGRIQPVYNVQNMTAFTASGEPSTQQHVHDAIVAGATAKGWQVRDEAPGHIVAQIFVRSHMAEVDITFDDKAYSVNYRSSSNLLHNGTQIHRNYNRWVKFMIEKINVALRQQ
ncbi:MAG: hypothetical protein COA62_03360 [Rhodobiaceae bacterium]|nr:MAG: hypothetical protein COA62_03360 [Rhodobiaceae bacterium]